MKVNVEIACDDDSWNKHTEINPKTIAKVVLEILGRYPNLSVIKKVELSILLTNNERMKQLNNDFRGQDKATNVLSFQDMDINWCNILDFKPEINYTYLGDIAFGYDIISLEAKDKGWTFYNYFTHLLVHGIMHLIGYDHLHDAEAEVMEQVEIAILKKFNIISPY